MSELIETRVPFDHESFIEAEMTSNYDGDDSVADKDGIEDFA